MYLVHLVITNKIIGGDQADRLFKKTPLVRYKRRRMSENLMQILCSRLRLLSLFLFFFFLKASWLQRNVRFFGSFLNSQHRASFVLTGG